MVTNNISRTRGLRERDCGRTHHETPHSNGTLSAGPEELVLHPQVKHMTSLFRGRGRLRVAGLPARCAGKGEEAGLHGALAADLPGQRQHHLGDQSTRLHLRVRLRRARADQARGYAVRFRRHRCHLGTRSVPLTRGTATITRSSDGMRRDPGSDETGDGVPLSSGKTLDAEGRVIREPRASEAADNVFKCAYQNSGGLLSSTDPAGVRAGSRWRRFCGASSWCGTCIS